MPSSPRLFESLTNIYGAETLAARPCLFSSAMLRVKADDVSTMAAVVGAIERVAAHPAYQQAVLGETLPPAKLAGMAAGVCMGYDFHLTHEGPKLIEINTNAGGLLLVADLVQAHGLDGEVIMQSALSMFRREWARERGDAPLRRIAIVDETPTTQFLYPEFLRFATLFDGAGIDAVIADPREMVFDGARLSWRGETIDLIYNRLTDFALTSPETAAINAAWQAGAVVLTPHPLAHRLFADKRNLEWLADPLRRASLGLAAADEAALSAVLLPIRGVRVDDADLLWSTRKQWFFKPAAGFGSKAVYRGDKITKRVFDEVLAGDYVAQAFAPPPEVALTGADGAPLTLKYDVRNYAYGGEVLAVAARLYQGQTTNFRTVGGGFAPVLPG